MIVVLKRLKSQDLIIKNMGDKIDLLQSQITQNNREGKRKLDEVLNILKGEPTNKNDDHTTVVENRVIQIIPDFLNTLKPKLMGKNIAIATYEYLSNPTKESFDVLSPQEKNTQKYFFQKIRVMSEMICGFIPLGYPEYSNNMNRNIWKKKLMIACKIGVKNLTDFVKKAGMKINKDPKSKLGISRTFVVQNAKHLKVEIERLEKTRTEMNEVRIDAEEEITTATEDV